MSPHLKALILIVVVLLAVYGAYHWWQQNKTNPYTNLEASEYSVEGDIKDIGSDYITIEIEEINREGEIFKRSLIKGILNNETEFYSIDTSTTPFTIKEASIQDFKTGQRIVLHTAQNPHSTQNFSVFKVELLP